MDSAVKILCDEIERLARVICTLRCLKPDQSFYGLPVWVNVVDSGAIDIIAKDNPLFNEFREASIESFEAMKGGSRWQRQS